MVNSRHLLLLFVREPIEGTVMPELANQVGGRESCLRYQALCLTLLEQLVGLEDTRIRFCVSPADGLEAVKFWLLAELDGTVEAIKPHLFLFNPKKSAPIIEVEFVPQITTDTKAQIRTQQAQGFADGYQTVSLMGTKCPDCGARWLRMAQLLCQSGKLPVIGTNSANSLYLSTSQTPVYFGNPPFDHAKALPTLPKITTESDWGKALQTAIGGKLAKKFRNVRNQI